MTYIIMGYSMRKLLTDLFHSNRLVVAVTILFVLSATVSIGQGLSAEDGARLGIKLVDDKEYSQGIKHLRAARNLDLGEYEYPFEIGRAFLLWGKAKKAEQYFFPLMAHEEVTSELFVLLADCYSSLDQPKKEIEALEIGLGKFPKSGIIHSNLGGVYAAVGDGPLALAYWEKGIEVDPGFAENYRHSAQFLASQHDHLWAWIYGQTYLNLTVANDQPDVSAMNFVRSSLFKLLSMKREKAKATGLDKVLYDLLFPCAVESENENSLKSAEVKLKCLVQAWAKVNDRPRVPVLDHMLKVNEHDRLLEYLFWLYGEADRTELNEWGANNAARFNEFATWVYRNGIDLESTKPFSRLNH
ncbi:MAG: tetratricopeptide (TPR) repeat protein [Granulosicoccus sp.]|jgi:tetratricopeptide (TPR) repeat protein